MRDASLKNSLNTPLRVVTKVHLNPMLIHRCVFELNFNKIRVTQQFDLVCDNNAYRNASLNSKDNYKFSLWCGSSQQGGMSIPLICITRVSVLEYSYKYFVMTQQWPISLCNIRKCTIFTRVTYEFSKHEL